MEIEPQTYSTLNNSVTLKEVLPFANNNNNNNNNNNKLLFVLIRKEKNNQHDVIETKYIINIVKLR